MSFAANSSSLYTCTYTDVEVYCMGVLIVFYSNYNNLPQVSFAVRGGDPLH